MKDSKTNPLDHPPETMIAAYAIGKCSPAMQSEIDEHCFTCESCRTRLSILLRLSSLEESELERGELERLFPLGKETIAQARQPFNPSQEQFTNKQIFSYPKDSSGRPANEFAQNQSFRSLGRFGRTRRLQIVALSILIVAIAGSGYYWYMKTHSPVQNSLLAMRRSPKLSRPLEARLSGEFDYKPFARTRGNEEGSDIDRDQIDHALLELTSVVASNRTPQERHALGRLYLFLGEFDKAETQMKLALDSLKHDAKLHSDLAALYYERSNYADADHVTLLHQAIEHYNHAVEIEPQFAEAWFNRALCHEKLFLFTKAKQDWEQYLKLDSNSKWAEEARERLKKLESRANRFNDSKKESQNKDSVVLLEKALNSKDEEALRSIISKDIVTVMQYSTNTLYEECLNADLNEKASQPELALTKLKKIGEFVAENKKDRFIADLAAFAARASPQMKSRMLSVHLKLRQADKEFSRSSHDAAFKLYQSAHLAAKHIGDELHAEIAESNLIRYSYLHANSESLITLGNNLLVRTERAGHRYLQAQTHSALANGYLASQQSGPALENGLRAASIAKEIDDKDTTINGLIFACVGYTRSGNYKLGINRSFEILSLINDHSVTQSRRFQIYQIMWEPLFRNGKYGLAIDYQQEALQIATSLNNQSGIVGATARVGINLWKLNLNNEAEQYLKSALTKLNLINDNTLRQLLEAELFTALGDVSLSMGKSNESVANYGLALEAVKISNNSVYLSAIYQGLASAYLAQSKIYEAESELHRSISLLEKGRQQITNAEGRSVFLARSQNVYQAMIDLQCHFKHDNEAAFDYAEKARNREVLDVLTHSALPKTTDGQLVLSLLPSTRPLKLKEVQKMMPRDRQLLSYSITEKSLIIWHVTSETFFSTSIAISQNALKEIISDYLLSITTRKSIETINEKASGLYRYFILPIENQLDSKKILYVIQDGLLSSLPFATLYSQETKHYLIEDYSIITNQSASALIQANALAEMKPPNTKESFIGISNPRFSYLRFQGLPALPYSEEEVSRAGSLYQQTKLLSQEKALESKIVQQIQNYNIVHFASHALNSKGSPLTSSILLANEDQPSAKNNHNPGIIFDGTLQAAEIYRLKLPLTKLVILSSCKSGIGDHTKGETIGALAQAFFAAKVPSVIASLWDIDDVSSSEVMYSFHNYHRNQSLGFAESLRQAQCSLLKGADISKRHPFYWAAFQLLGSNTGSVAINN